MVEDAFQPNSLRDCFKFLPSVADRSEQTVFVDPPYNIGFNYGNGGAEDRLPAESYLARMDLLIRHCERTLSPTGSLWFLCPDGGQIRLAQCFRRECRGGIGSSGERLLANIAKTDFPTGTDICSACQRRKADAILHRCHKSCIATNEERRLASKWTSRPDDVWQIPRLTGNSAERVSGHPCQIPEALLERIVLCSSQLGELVLDPMAGAGSTLVVARRLGRRYLGCERDPKFAQLIEKRLEQDYQPNLF